MADLEGRLMPSQNAYFPRGAATVATVATVRLPNDETVATIAGIAARLAKTENFDDRQIELEERAAIIAEGCGISQGEATRLARREAEGGATHAVAERIELWLGALDRLSALGDCDAALCAASIDFALSPWAYPAVIFGWSDADLFGLPAGLIPQRKRRTLHLLAMDAHGVTLMTGRGIVATFERGRFRCSDQRPWWLRDHQRKAVA
jgi:hypothetical protein